MPNTMIRKADFVLPRLNRGLFFDDLDGALGTLDFACHADEAFFRSYGNRFPFSDFKDFHGANVNASSVSVTFF